jgi:hypothetical protein
MKINHFTIYGERCSGTNYIEKLILSNFNVDITWKYGWKHFFGFNDLSHSEDVLFIGITRNLFDWINSLYIKKHHLPLKYLENITEEEKINKFLNDEWFSVNDALHSYKTWSKENLFDRNIYTGLRYKNIFELRHFKNKFLLEDMPNKVKNYIFIKYEDIVKDFKNTIVKIEKKGLIIKNKKFPENILKEGNNINYFISKQMIYRNKNLITYYEKKLKYIEKIFI